MDEEFKKLQAILKSLKMANARLDDALKEKYSQLVRDAIIQRFEFTFELAWKSMRQCLKARYEKDINNPRDVIEESYKNKMIDDFGAWKVLLRTRNFTTHLYDENESENAYKTIKKHKYLTDSLIEKLEAIAKNKNG